MISLLFSVMLLASDPSAVAADATQPVQGAPVAAAPKKEKKICKEDPAYTGSRMKKQICLTAAEWDRHNHSGINSSGSSGRSYTAQ